MSIDARVENPADIDVDAEPVVIDVDFLQGSTLLEADFGESIGAVDAYETYQGAYEVRSSLGGPDQTMRTASKLMTQNVVVKAITVSETSNPAGGTTILIKE